MCDRCLRPICPGCDGPDPDELTDPAFDAEERELNAEMHERWDEARDAAAYRRSAAEWRWF